MRRLAIIMLLVVLLVVPSLGATRYIATNGSDSNPGTTGSRFLTWNKCYQVSALGDTCIIGSGTYVANQDFVTNAAIAGGTFHQTPTGTGEVTFQSETGNNSDVVLTGDLHFGSSFTTSPPDHITIKNITLGDGTIGADGYTANGWMQIRAAHDIHFVGVHFKYVQQWNCADYVSDQFAEHGPSTYPDLMDLYGDAYSTCNITPGHWLIEDSVLHGMTTNNAGDHPDAIAPDGNRDLIVRRNTFYNNCGINYRGGPISGNTTVENNYFGPPVNCAVGTLFNVSITGPATIRFNTIDGTIQPPNSPWNNNQLYDSNIINGQINGGNCPNGTATVAQYNVWLNSNPTGACGGAGNTRVASMAGWFVATPTNYDLTATASAALGAANPSSFPATDIHLTSRTAPITAGGFQRASGGPPAGGQYYVSVSGSGSACSSGSPCSPSTAIAQFVLTNPGGATINFSPGNYNTVLNVSRGGSSTSIRLLLKCTVAPVIGGSNNCRGIQFNTFNVNNVDIQWFEYTNPGGQVFIDDPAQCTSGVTCPNGNSIHMLYNYVHDLSTSFCNSSGALLTGQHGHPATDIWAIGNVLDSIGPFGSVCNTMQGIYIIGLGARIQDNIITRASSAIQYYDSACGGSISNNTIVNNHTGIIAYGGNACSAGNNTISNNIVSNNSNYAFNNSFSGDQGSSSGHPTLYTNNIVFGNGNTFTSTPSSNTTVQNQKSENPTATFVNYTGTAFGDYHLKSGSIAIAGGSTQCVSGGTCPAVPTTDIAGTAMSSPPPIGAFTSGGGGGAPIPQASPTSLAFSNVLVATDSTIQTSTISNSGSASYSITSETISDGNFLFGGIGTCAVGQVIAPGQSCTVSVKFHPTSTGAKSGTLNVGTSVSPLVISLSGTGTAPIVSLAPSSLAFGNQTLGTTSAIQGVTLSNTGSGALSISAIALGGTNPTQFTQSNTCGATVAAGASCTFSVTFKPTVLGAQSASISITDNAAGSPQAIPLTGTGTGTPNPALSPASLTFSSQLVGTSSSSQPATLTNNGTAPLTINSITASGDYAQTNNCVSPLAVSASCTINVTFMPTAPGTRSGSLVVSSNGPGSPNTAALSGTGIQGAIALAPTSLTFTALNVGSTSAGQVIAISNPGTATVTLNSVALTGTNAADFGLTNGCGATLTAGASCNATITFTPFATGSRTASLTITDSAPGSPHQAPLTGTGTAPVASLAPSSIAFGNQINGSISSAQNFTLSNTGTGSLTISSIALTGINANQFAQTSACGATLGAGANCTIAIRFAPTSVGAKSASLTVTDSASGSPHSSTLSGTGIAGAPVASLSPTSLTFSSTLLGVTSAGQVVTLQNTGTAILNISAIATTGDYSQTNTCGATLAVSASCPITVRFTPTVAGTRTGNLTVTDNASGSPQAVPLSGTGTSPGGGGSGIAVFSPTSLTFSSQVTNTSSAAQVLTLSNTDTSTMSISTITFAGGNPTDYSQTNNCVPSLGAGASCTVNITFTPLGVGSRPATVVFTDSASDSPQSIPLSGTGIAPFPIVQLTPPSLDFGSIQQGSTTAGQTVAVKNIGTAILNISSITKTGANAADYGLTNGCGATLAINATCTLTINFTPSSTGTRAASISIADDATNTPQAVPLTGAGTPAPAPKVSLSASSLTYAAQQVGTSSGSQSVTVTNIGDATLNLTSILLGPPNATDYTLTNGCGATLAAAASCTLGVVFNPVAAGTRVSTVTLTDNATDSPQSFNLTGTAFTGTPTADLSVSTLIFLSQVVLTTSSAQTIALTNNGTASLLITSIVASSDSAPGSNEFFRTTNCSGTLPAGASCTVNVTFTPQAIGTRTGKVTFTDSASGSPQIVSLVGTGQNPPPPPGSAATGIGGRAGVGGKSGIGVH